MIASIHHGPCKNEATGMYAFCTVHAMGTQHEKIYPIGACRENGKPGKTPCEHKSEEDAKACYLQYEMEHYVKGLIQPKDLILPREMLPLMVAFTHILDETVKALEPLPDLPAKS